MKYKEIREIMKDLSEKHYDSYIKSIISIETGINDEDELEAIYSRYMENDNISLLSEDLA